MPEDWQNASGLVAFHREVKGNKVIVLANFGVPEEKEPVAQVADANDNRPQGDVVAEPFKNLEAEPVSQLLKLDGEYTNAFDGSVMSGDVNITLAPGEFLVLTR